ncbi:hypothetical protein [Arcobacter arenosus]|uniref:Uncharacterized protein n=1 Tax=Arcobacter arenosus TaxID=2576037 RepID=A0A5R8Y349_9BACT|nr:hypothetical protein [Arcobacter arenosus]TLP40485.1 hypothetical protein FDK22_00290 [Arcobacter arenosus]
MTQDMPIEQNMGISLTTKMNKKEILNFAKVFIIVDLCIIIYAIIAYDKIWVLNTQVAFFGSLFVTLASYFSYQRNIKNRLSNFDSSNEKKILDDRDKVDEIDDPFDLYSEDVEPIAEEDLTPEKIKEIIQEEKSKVKKNSLKNTFFSASGFISIYRIFGYGFLIFGFFALNNNKIFLPIPFLVGLAIVPISVLLAKFTLRLMEDQ